MNIRLFALACVAVMLMGCQVYTYDGPPPRVAAPVYYTPYRAPEYHRTTTYVPVPVIQAEAHVIIGTTPAYPTPGCQRPPARKPSHHHHGRHHRH